MPLDRLPGTASPLEIAYDHYDPEDEGRRESLFSLGNGIIALRGCAPEAGPGKAHYPGTYRAGCYDSLAGTVEGERVEIESLVNLPNWLPLTFRIGGETGWFSLDDVEILSYRHALDPRQGIVERSVRFRDARGRRTRLDERRFVSMARPHLAALRLEIVPEDWSGTIEIRSSLDCGTVNGKVAPGDGYDPRALDMLGLSPEEPDLLLAEARTRRSRIAVAVGVRTVLAAGSAVPGSERTVRPGETVIERHFACAARAGEAVAVEKTAAVFTSQDPAIPEPAEAARHALREAPGFARMREEHAAAWDLLWTRFPLEVEGENRARSLTLNAFHLMQTVSPHSSGLDAGLPSRGWQEAYHGQVFWDETLSFPLLNLRFPGISRALLLYRYRRLDEARAAARAHGHRGAMYPWRSALTGREVTPAFQKNGLTGERTRDHTHLQRHVGAAVAWNVWHYFVATGDVEFLTDHGAEMLVEIARFWASIARFDPGTGRYGISGVMGPDEYHTGYPGAVSPGLVDNAYTNVMASWILARARDVTDLLPARHRRELCRRLDIGAEESHLWEEVGRGLRLAFHGEGIVSQFDGFERLRPLDLDAFMQGHPDRRVDWLLARQGEDINAWQVLKQADFAMLAYLMPLEELTRTLGRMGYDVGPDRIRQSIHHYLGRTAHDSSLSDLVYAGALAQLDPEASWRLYCNALRPDAKFGHSGTEQGIHLGAMAASLDILQRRYLGIMPTVEGLGIDPAPPPGLGRARLEVLYRSGTFIVALEEGRLTICADPANLSSATILHRGQAEHLRPGGELSFEL
jgi:trehalose/maltose hydrolase-like predicted phosphorylase